MVDRNTLAAAGTGAIMSNNLKILALWQQTKTKPLVAVKLRH